ncbi:hypothetical protein HRR78_000166 [Exophiala dermatitidis]|nr:hypothetical protein HRR75_001073 [Exophiala dermatitidis]KAJ4559646.1 hypothetical protein HRR78_000166 [Exophiala dermatitidis]
MDPSWAGQEYPTGATYQEDDSRYATISPMTTLQLAQRHQMDNLQSDEAPNLIANRPKLGGKN